MPKMEITIDDSVLNSLSTLADAIRQNTEAISRLTEQMQKSKKTTTRKSKTTKKVKTEPTETEPSKVPSEPDTSSRKTKKSASANTEAVPAAETTEAPSDTTKSASDTGSPVTGPAGTENSGQPENQETDTNLQKLEAELLQKGGAIVHSFKDNRGTKLLINMMSSQFGVNKLSAIPKTRYPEVNQAMDTLLKQIQEDNERKEA